MKSSLAGRHPAVSLPRNERGAVLLESALTIGLLLFILIIGLDFALHIYRFHVAAHVANEVARQAAVNNVGGSTPVQRATNVVNLTRQLAARMRFSIDPASIKVCPITPINVTVNCTTNSTGDGSGYFVLFIRQPAKSIIGFSFNVTAGAIVRNEPFR